MSIHLPRDAKILIIGDSYVEGVGSKSGGWAKAFSNSHPAYQICIDGKGGRTSIDVKHGIQKWQSFEPDAVIVEVGLNDSRYRPSKQANEVSPEEFEANLEEIFQTSRDIGADIVAFIGLSYIDERHTNPYKDDKYYSNSYVTRYNSIIEATALRHGCLFIQAPDLVELGALSDGLHPTEEGHSRIQSAVSKIVRG